MKFENVTALTKNAVELALGKDYFFETPAPTEEVPNPKPVAVPIESYKLVDIGSDINEKGTVDVYVKGLIVQMAQLYVESREYVGRIPSIFVETSEWGGYVERVVFDLANISDDDMYNLINGKVYEDDHRFYQPTAKVKMFQEAKAIRVNISIVRKQLFEAFNSWDQQNTFISGIYANVQRTINTMLYVYALMLLSSGIAVSNIRLKNAVHVLTEAKKLGIVSENMSSEEAMRDSKVLSFALERMSETRSNMEVIGNAFNNGEVPSHTPFADNKAVLLTGFSRACKFLVKANTFNEEYVGIGEYDTVPAWQGIATKKGDERSFYDFSTASSISIKADPNNKLGIGIDEVNLSNCIGIIFDRYALGITLNRMEVTSSYTASADFWNEFTHILVNYILDTNYNMVAFFMD